MTASIGRVPALVVVLLLCTFDLIDAQVPVETPVITTETETEGPPVSPRGAFFRSLVLPGWGQTYVGAPGRGAVYFSLTSGSVWMTFLARRQLQDARRHEEWLRQTGQIQPTEESELAVARGRQFEDWITLSIFLAFFSGADAYVAAYLADFEERIGVVPRPDGSVQFRTSIPVGWPR